MKRMLLILALTVLIPTTIKAQVPQPLRDADVWCVQHHPCDWVGHASFTFGGTLLLDVLTPLSVSETRWFLVVFYVQRDIRQLIMWGPGTQDASKILPLPLWLDSIFDMGGVVFGVWAASQIDLPFDLFVSSQSASVSIGVF